MRTFIIIITFLINLSCLATLELDSLIASLENQTNDTNRVNILNEIAWQLKKSDSKRAKDYANEAKNLSENISFRTGYLTSLNRIGTIEIYAKQYNTAEKVYLDILSQEENDGHTFGIGRASTQLGEIYRCKGNYQKALKYSLNALRAYQTIQRHSSIALISNNLGSIYKQLGDYDKALVYLNKSLEFRKKMNKPRGLAQSYLNIGAFHITLKNYSEALNYLKNAEKLFLDLNDNYELAKVYGNLGTINRTQSKFIESLNYFRKSERIKKKLGTADNDPLLYNNIGAVYYSMGSLDSALWYYQKSFQIQESNSQGITLLESYNNLGDIYDQKNNAKEAIHYYYKALVFAEKSNKKVSEIQILRNLANCYSKTKQYGLATEYSSRYIELSDSLEHNFRTAIELNTRFKEQEQKTLLLEKEKEITQANLDKSIARNDLQQTIIFSLIIGVTLTLLLFFSIFRIRRQRQKIELAEKSTKIEQQRISQLLKKQELKSLNAMIEGQEEERKRIAQDLHDRLGSMLAMVKAHFSNVEEDIEKLKVTNSIQYEKANSLLDKACEEVRKIAHNMSSGVLDKFGLVPALEDLKEILEQSGKIKTVEFIAFGIDQRLHQDMEITIYRIVQELISNVLKYSKANELTIQLVKANDNLNLTLEDDGIGFDISTSQNGMGLKNIASRVDSLNGVLDIDSRINNGTLVTIDIPVKTK